MIFVDLGGGGGLFLDFGVCLWPPPPLSLSLSLSLSLCRVIVPPRKSSKTVIAKGFFADAVVVRGHDWLWGDQDGMNTPQIQILISL